MVPEKTHDHEIVAATGSAARDTSQKGRRAWAFWCSRLRHVRTPAGARFRACMDVTRGTGCRQRRATGGFLALFPCWPFGPRLARFHGNGAALKAFGDLDRQQPVIPGHQATGRAGVTPSARPSTTRPRPPARGGASRRLIQVLSDSTRESKIDMRPSSGLRSSSQDDQ